MATSFEPPDTIAALPARPFEFSQGACDEADVIVAQPPEALFRRLIGDQESEAVWLVARRVLDSFLTGTRSGVDEDASADEIAAYLGELTGPLTAGHGSFCLALSRLPANFLPELVGVHYCVLALGVDDRLLGLPPMLAEADLRDVLAAYLALAGPTERARLHAGIGCAIELEREHGRLLAELAAWHQRLPLESKVAAVIARPPPFPAPPLNRPPAPPHPLAPTSPHPHLPPPRLTA